jgi:hypothetical protein
MSSDEAQRQIAIPVEGTERRSALAGSVGAANRGSIFINVPSWPPERDGVRPDSVPDSVIEWGQSTSGKGSLAPIRLCGGPANRAGIAFTDALRAGPQANRS